MSLNPSCSNNDPTDPGLEPPSSQPAPDNALPARLKRNCFYVTKPCAKFDREVCLSCEAAAALQRADERETKLRAFALEMIRPTFEGYDMDGGSIQEYAVKRGLLEEVVRTKPCREEGCVCAEIADFPTTCYEFTEVLKEGA